MNRVRSHEARSNGPSLQGIVIPFLIPGTAIIAASFAGTASPLLFVMTLLLTPAVLTPLAHNYDKLGAKMCQKDDRFMLEACSSGMISNFRLLYRHLPADPRCRVCFVPFGGIGRLLRVTPSRKNPNFCSSCIDTAPEGVHEMEIGVLFVDIRGFTAWSESKPASEAAKRVARFYRIASRALMRDDALVEFVGDQVMALYLPAFPSLRGRVADVMLSAAQRLVDEVLREQDPDPLEIGIGVNFGIASIGNVRKGAEKDFTAVGDVVNTAARLQAAAGPGQIVVADHVFDRLEARPDGSESRLVEVKGKQDPLPVYVVHP